MASTFVDDPRDRAFERLYERYDRDVYRYVLAVLRNPSEAEDVTQTTFLNAYRALQAGEQPQKPHNWLIAIAHNACRSRVRFAMRRPKEVPLDDVVEQLTVPDSERTNVRELLRALGRLPFNQRAAITMRELEGRSYPEIADTLGVTVPAVEALISRARKALRLQAAALRGFAVLQLPRSLRRYFEHGDAGASAVGAGVAGKAAAVLVAGALAGGVGYSAVEKPAGSTHGPAVPRLELLTRNVPRAAVRHARTRPATARHVAHTRRAATLVSGPAASTRASFRARPDDPPAQAVPAAGSPAPAAGPAERSAPAAAAPAPTTAAPAAPVATEATTTVQQTVTTLPAGLPDPPPPVQLPPVQVPTVPLPPVPDAPSVPLP
jgi:RNA polymerase sigma factor (sigma-70 family)